MQPVNARQLFKGLWPDAPEDMLITGVETDSRRVKPGCVFVAIKGERADGHDFAAGALRDGAAVVMATRPVEGVPKEKLVVVPDILDGMITLGGNYRGLFSPLLLAVTGSVGKTTTKEFCAAIFSSFGKTLKTEGNQNNEIGMPNTLFRLEDETRYAVVEMGMQGLGEISKLTRAAQPDGAIITKIGLAHIEQLGSIENVLAAKMEVGEGVRPGGPLILNGDDQLLWSVRPPMGVRMVYAGIDNIDCDVVARHIRREAHGQTFQINDKQYGCREAFIPTIGRHTVQDALLAYTAATRLGLSAEQSAAALAAYVTTGNRQYIEQIGDITLIEDFYNAGPDSMAAALATLGEYETDGRRIAVLGDMLELGTVSDEQHKALGPQVQSAGVELLITVGTQAALAAENSKHRGIPVAVCESNEQAAEVLEKEVRPGDAVLMKASRGMRFEEILEHFKARLGSRAKDADDTSSA